jgi:hypothetical protein
MFQVETEVHKSVYSSRSLAVQSRAQLSTWLKAHSVPNAPTEANLHCSVIVSDRIPTEYIPDRDPVELQPTTYRLGLLGPAFVLFFDCPRLEYQWQRAISTGIRMYYPRFVPHISLSYSVPSDWSYQTLTPPSFQLLLTEEIIAPYNCNFRQECVY